MEVPAGDLPTTVPDENAFGLPDEQLETLKRIWYEDGHCSGIKKMWELLRRQAEAQGAEPFFHLSRPRLSRAIHPLPRSATWEPRTGTSLPSQRPHERKACHPVHCCKLPLACCRADIIDCVSTLLQVAV
eukprot:COSAG06_NODE_414_length_16033_cov_67.366717_11_plen_130_part_00